MIDLDLVYAAYQAKEERTRQQNIVIARDYYAGEQNTKMSKRQEEYIGYNLTTERFAINYCAPVVDAPVERMIVSGFTGDDEDYAAWCWGVWQHNRMDAKQRDTHQQAVNEGESFIVVDWPEGDDYPTFIPHPRYTDASLGGTGYGCKAHYTEGDHNQPLEAISKRWREAYRDDKGVSKLRERMNIYYPDRIERWVALTENKLHDAGWTEFIEGEGDDADVWPIPWVNGTGEPLGIPIAHIRKPGTFELWDAIPLQDIINKTALDILATADSCGFPIRMAYNWVATTDGKAPESDGGNYLTLTPGAWVSIMGDDAKTEVIPPADLIPMLAALDSYIMKLAQVTDTPAARFQITGQIAAEGTLKQQEGPLLAKVRAYKTLIGNGWEDLFDIVRSLGQVHGKTFGEDAELETQWEPSETRDDKAELETLVLKRQLEVSREMIWEEMGYDPDQIARMQAEIAEELASTSNLGGALLQQFERGV